MSAEHQGECEPVLKPPYEFSEEAMAKGFSRDTTEAFKAFVRSTTLQEGFLLNTGARVDEVFLAFLEEIDPIVKRLWTCNACLRFFRDIGSTVTVESDGSLSSPLWSRELPENLGGYAELVKALERAVLTAEITGYYTRRKPLVGNNEMAEFNHLYVELGDKHRSLLAKWERDGELRGRVEGYQKQLINIVGSVPKDRMTAFVTALSTRPVALSRPLAHAKWIVSVLEGFDAAGPEKDMNYLWRQAVLAPLGYPGWNSCLLKMGFDKFETQGEEEALATLERELAPDRYQVETRPLTEGRIAAAAKKFSESGAEKSLHQRYATVDDIQEWFWRTPQESKEVETPDPDQHTITEEVTSRDTFIEKIAPTAQALWLEINPTASSHLLCIFACATDPTSVPILAWDSDEKRNTVSLGVWFGGEIFKHMGFMTKYNRIVGITGHPGTWHGRQFVGYHAPVFVFEGPTKVEVQSLIFKEHVNPQFRSEAGTIATLARELTLDQSVDPAKRLRGYWVNPTIPTTDRVIALIDGQYIRYHLNEGSTTHTSVATTSTTSSADTAEKAQDESTKKPE